LNDDNFLPLPRKSEPGEPVNWVGVNFKNRWINRTILLVIPTIGTGRNGYFVGITELKPGTNFTKGINGECRFILDTMESYNGPVIFLGKDTEGTEILARRTSDTRGLVTLPESLEKVRKEFKGSKVQHELIENDAFADFMTQVLENKGAFGIPLDLEGEKKLELQEQTESTCLNYLYADIIVRG
jgi:hypothetical protein